MRALIVLRVVALGLLPVVSCQPAAPASHGSAGAVSPQGSGSLESVRPLDLTPREQREWEAHLNRFVSPCAEAGTTLAQCIQHGGTCRICPAASRFVADSIRAGHVAPQVEARYAARFDPSAVQIIDTRGEPSIGPSDAPVTIVEFADFQCPFCAASAPLIDSVVESYAPHVRAVFKHFPIGYHVHAEMTARAAVAAQNQGKFWELHHMMFANRENLDDAEVERYAASLGLDIARFRRDRDSDETAKRVKASYDEGVRLDVRGTPTFFINGRVFDFDLFDFGGDDLQDWIELEIELATGKRFSEAAPIRDAPGERARRLAWRDNGRFEEESR